MNFIENPSANLIFIWQHLCLSFNICTYYFVLYCIVFGMPFQILTQIQILEHTTVTKIVQVPAHVEFTLQGATYYKLENK